MMINMDNIEYEALDDYLDGLDDLIFPFEHVLRATGPYSGYHRDLAANVPSVWDCPQCGGPVDSDDDIGHCRSCYSIIGRDGPLEFQQLYFGSSEIKVRLTGSGKQYVIPNSNDNEVYTIGGTLTFGCTVGTRFWSDMAAANWSGASNWSKV